MKRSNYICLLICLFLTVIPIHNYSQHIRFSHFQEKDGLNDDRVYKITEDHKGFMWFATGAGIARYDGYQFKQFKNDLYDSNSLSGYHTYEIYADREDIIWIGVGGLGLDKYDPRTAKFTHYVFSRETPLGVSNNDISDILEDKDGLFWVATWGGGLNLFDREKETFTHIKHDPEKPNTLISDFIKVVVEDPTANGSVLWVGTPLGLDRFDYNLQQVTHYQHDSTNQNSLGWNWIDDLWITPTGKLWIGTREGVDFFDPETEQFTHYRTNPNDSNSLSSNRVSCLIEDSSGDVWVGTADQTLNRIIFDQSDKSNQRPRFVRYKHDPFNPASLSDDLGSNDLFEDNSGSIWIGHDHGGLDKFDPTTESFINYKKVPSDINSIDDNFVTDIYQDPRGILWVSTDGGLNRIDRNKGSYQYFSLKDESPSSDAPIISTITPDLKNTDILWMGTYQGLYNFSKSKGEFRKYPNTGSAVYLKQDQYGNIWYVSGHSGLSKFNTSDQSLISYHHDPGNNGSLSSEKVTYVYIEPGKADTVIWICGWNGLNRFDTRTEEFKRYLFDPNDSLSISHPKVLSIAKDKQGNLWASTQSSLDKLDLKTGIFTRYSPPDTRDIRGIGSLTLDNEGYLWEGSDYGLWKFNPQTGEFKWYVYEDGISEGEIVGLLFNQASGEMFANGELGFTTFFPGLLQENQNVPPIVLTSFKKFNKEVVLDTSISYIKQITLEPDENVFSFEFAALNYVNSQQNEYAYKMKGFDRDWINTIASKRIANYTNLDPGDYTFTVRGSNNDGLWNEAGASVKITILPHWWESNLAYFIYLLLFLGGVYRYRNFELNRVKLQQQYEMEHFETNKLKEIDQVKSRFFANISHEFRTPLTLILGPIQKILSRAIDSDSQQDLNLMQRQAKHLLDLVSQLLDLSKLEAGKMKVQVSKRNIVPLLKGLALSFASLAERDNKTLRFENDLEDIQVYVDKEAITRIINNLLSNAFKFTADTGSVAVGVKVLPESESFNAGSLEITVTDNGIGIPATRVEKIFDRFYQVDNSETREREGTGIGLSLTRELVELHQGSISVTSNEGAGTSVIVRLPLGREHLRPDEILDLELEEADGILDDHLIAADEISAPAESLVDESKPILLIVEDNIDVRNYVRSDLDELYNCHEAVDGVAGLEQALEHIPDLIISDVMMPRMDGVEFCKEIKTDERTSHIPVILLTAKADLESKLEGLETGADAYITKPFETQELRVRIKNLIEQRELLRERYQQDPNLVPAGLNLSSMDEQFLEKASQISRDHIDDLDFNVDALSRKIFMSRQHLNRKLKALTGRTAVEFIRTIRLKSAAILLRNQQSTIAEIAYQVGYTNASHFAKAFHEEFGNSPSDYMTQHQGRET